MKRLALILMLFPTAARAQSYGDGGTHVVDGVAGPIEVFNGTTVDVVDPAKVTGGFTAYSDSTVNVIGGKILGANAFGEGLRGGAGLTSQGIFSGTGGTILGGTCVDAQGVGGHGLISMNADTTISAGLFEGGGGSMDAGAGGTGLSVVGGTLNISGGVFHGGHAALDGVGASILTDGDTRDVISGGTFIGQRSLSLFARGTSTLDISGGSFQGLFSFDLYGQSSVRFLGHGFSYDPETSPYTGALTGILDDGTTLSLDLASFSGFKVEQDALGIRFLSIDAHVPEPSSVSLLAAGAVALGVVVSCNRRKGIPTP